MVGISERIREVSCWSYLARWFPFLTWMQTYTLRTLRGDIIAGITCGLLIIPQGIAYANLAGLPAEYGLYTAMTPGIIYCLFGTSKDVSVGPTVTMALFTNRFNATHSPIGGSALAFLVGCVLFAMTILRLGFITKFMPMHVNSGFVSAAAVVVSVSQLKNLFGLTKAPQSFVGKVEHFFTSVKFFNKYDLMLGSGCIVFLALFMYLSRSPLKKLQQKPGTFWKVISNTLWFSCIARSGVVCILGTMICYGVVEHGPGKVLTLAGRLPTGLPAVVSPFSDAFIPETNSTMTFSDFAKSFSSGLIVLPVIQFVQAVSIAKAFGKIYSYETDSTSELIALAMGNIFGSFFGGWPVTGSFSGSAVNAMSGTQTPFSSVIACGLVFLAVGFMMPLFYYIPKCVLGAMIAMAVVTMIDYKTPIRIWKVRKIDLLPYLVSFFGTFYTLETGVLAGAVVSLLVMVSYEVDPHHEVIKNGDGESITVIFKGNLSYPAIENIKDTVNEAAKEHQDLKKVCIDMGHVYHIDYAVVNSLRTLVGELDGKGIFVDFINFIDPNVEESFRRGKLEREAMVKVQALDSEKSDNTGIEKGDIEEDATTFHLNDANSDVKILVNGNGHDKLRRRASSVMTTTGKQTDSV